MDKQEDFGLTSSGDSTIRCEIPLKLPSLNEYVKACRGGWQGGHSMKAKTDAKIMPYLADLPRFENPIRIHWLYSFIKESV